MAGRKKRKREITRWEVDTAYRVPNFVIELTGLDTKKKILKCFGAHVIFVREGDEVRVFNERDPTAAFDPKRGRLDLLSAADSPCRKPTKR